ncbi:MAG: response regulator [Deltaproteobacteria bacterium]|nr:response regulator [Deltaproteobacteria bacterium]
MNKRILFVDDDEKILTSMTRMLRSGFEVLTANRAEGGLKVLAEQGPVAVVVSDQRMPGMTGVEFLAKAREVSPDTVRVMLTGYADLEAAMAAVNEGNVFRFLAKPCALPVLLSTINACLEQYRLVMAERELLDGTLKGSVKMLTEVVSLLRPEDYGQVSRILPHVRKLAMTLEVQNPWVLETAASLCLLGYMSLPDIVLAKVRERVPMTSKEAKAYYEHPATSAGLISKIPRMEEVAGIVAYQEKWYDGRGVPRDGLKGSDIPLGSRILKVALDFDRLLESGKAKGDAFIILSRKREIYDPSVVKAFGQILAQEKEYLVQSVSLVGLKEGMVLAEGAYVVRAGERLKVLPKGHVLGDVSLDRLFQLAKFNRVVEPIPVLVQIDGDRVREAADDGGK